MSDYEKVPPIDAERPEVCTMVLVRTGPQPWEVGYRKLLHVVAREPA